MSGLSPGAIAPDGTVASLKSGVAAVLGVSRGAGLPTKKLVRSAVLATEAGSVRVAVGLQKLDIVFVPNGVVIGSGGTKGGELTEGLKGLTEDGDDKTPDDGDDVKTPDDGDAALPAAVLVRPVIPAGHIVIAPRDVPGNGANMPR
jgi:hypothetical protein